MEVTGAVYDGTRQHRSVSTAGGERIEAHAVITAVGQLTPSEGPRPDRTRRVPRPDLLLRPLDNGWFAALRRDDVELVTEPVPAITTTGIRGADGTATDADVVVLCTGFETHKQLHPLDVRGRDGTSIRDRWGPTTPTRTSASPSRGSRTCS